ITLFLLVSIVVSQDISSTTFFFVASGRIHVIPGNFYSFAHFKYIAMRSYSEGIMDKPRLYNMSVIIQDSDMIKIENLEFDFLNLVNNSNIEVYGVILKGIYSVSLSSSNAVVCNTSFYGSYLPYSLFFENATVQLENVVISNSKSNGIYIDQIGNHSNLNNVRIWCDGCYALTIKGRHYSSYITVRDVVVTGGEIQFKSIFSHLSISNFEVTAYQNKTCNEFLFSVDDCSSDISITNLAVNEGQITIKITGNHFTIRNVTVKATKTSDVLTLESFLCSLLFIDGSSNSHNVNIMETKAIGGTITVEKITSNLSITGLYTDVALFVGHNGNNIDVSNVYVLGMMDVMFNRKNVTLRNIVVGSNNNFIITFETEIYNKPWNASGFTVLNSGSNIRISNVTVYNGIGLIMRNRNNISLKNVTVHVTDSFNKTNARKFLDPTSEIQLSGLAVANNYNGITLESITIINSMMAVIGNNNGIFISHIYLISYEQSQGVFISKNKDNIKLSDIIVDGYAEVFISQNGHYLTIKNKIHASQFIIMQNGNNISVINVTATNNTGLSFQSNGDNITLSNVTIKGVSTGCGLDFLYNKSPRGLINLINVTVSECNCGIYAYGQSLLSFTDHPTNLINNTSINNGAGMQIGKGIILKSNVEVNFINNTAYGVGGAIYVDISVLKIETLIEDCTFQNFTPIFMNNNALLAGNDVYNGKIWKCKGINIFNTIRRDIRTSPFTEAINCSANIYLQKFPTPLSSYITSTPIGVCLCINNTTTTTDCNARFIHKQLYPGQYISLPLVTVGMCGGISPTVLVITNTSTIEVLLNSSDSQETKRECKYFTYQLKMVTSKRKGTFFIKHRFDSIENQYRLYNSYLTVNVSFFKCPLGLELVSKVCQCNDALHNSGVAECDIQWMPHPIRRSGNNWLYYNHEHNCTVLHKHCPFDYCNVSSLYLSLNDGDTQCSHERSGILCGGCKAGLSLMLGSNRCHYCDNKYLSLTIAFIVVGIALVAFLTVCNMTVSIGSINGLLFYANIVKLNEVYFFPNGASIPVLSQFIAWLNLDLGIETCLYNGMDGYWKTWLQYAFPIYIWLLVGAIIIGSHYSTRICHLCGNNAVPVLATLILMSYSKLLQTVTKSLMSSTINCEGVKVKVWSVNGNIDYLSTKHIPLFVTAMLFLTVGLVYTVVVFTAQWLQRYSGKCCSKSSCDPVVKLKPFIDAYVGPYKDKYRFWTGLFLIVRLILTPVFSYTTTAIPQVNNYIIIFIASVALYLSRGIYRYNILNFLEAFYFSNLGLVTLLNLLSSNMGLNEEISLTITAASVSLCFITFNITVLVHVHIKKCHAVISKKFSKNRARSWEEFDLMEDNSRDETQYSPSHIITRRESMIFDFSIDNEHTL
uniref:Right handed beta helix domain-containing protein n=1 Tax=Amphimedon queenslandica TaxID=400682 RepID=A0A1X7UFW1_AMPQE